MKKWIFIVNFFLISCGSLHESPVVYFSNLSSKPIKDIRCEWADEVLTLPALNPGDSRSQSFYLRRDSTFFGLVKVYWVNNDGEKVSREFFFKEQNLPSISDHTTYNFVQIYFDQHSLEVVSSDAPDLSGKTSRMDQMLTAYREQYLQGGAAAPQTALISVKPVKDRSLPNWLATSY